MRKFAKFFIAVALLGAYACTTDTTETLDPTHGQGLTEITISIEESRTQLGEEPVNGLYPLYWSKGDQISVNGLPSNELTAEEAGKKSAKFSVQGLTAETYHIAYPAAGENEVLFAENQVHTANTTFGSGVSTMYGKCNAGEPVTLQHLTGVLKIGVTGSAKLTHAQISTIDRAPIAGAFAINFDNGELTPSADAKEVINYSFDEGVSLTNDPTYIHVAVPAGVYDELYVTLYDNAGGVMYATVTAAKAEPLTAGKIRTFDKNIAYEAKNNVKYFVIRDVATLKQFATKAAAGEAIDAILVADVDLAGESWTPIEGGGFSGTVLGNGYSIKGLNAPLFNTTSASFKGLHLEGVAINETANPNVGALARAIVATDAVKPIVEHCSANGTITVNCTEYTLAEGATETMAPFAIGGLVGRVEGVDLENVTTNVALDVDQVIATSNATKFYIPVGGVVGLVSNYNTTLSNLSNLENTAVVDVHEVSNTSATYGNAFALPYVGGVAGHMTISNHDCTVSNLTNRGNISVGGYYSAGAGETGDIDYTDVDVCVAGVVGYLDSADASGLKNYGNLTYDNGSLWFLYLGGVASMLGENAVLTNSENHGNIVVPFEGKTAPKAVFFHCGGVVGHTWAGSTLSSCDNYGGINVNSSISVATSSATAHRYFRVGGVACVTSGTISNCHNKKGANIDISGTISGTQNWVDVVVAGVVAVANNHSVTNCSNSGAVKSGLNNANKDNCHTNVGGVVGIAYQPCDNVTNSGTLIFLGHQKSLYFGGCVGHLAYTENTDKVGKYTNSGSIEFRGTTGEHSNQNYCDIAKVAKIGGCIGNAEGAVYNATNSGKMELRGVKHSGNCYYGGVVGHLTSTAVGGIHTCSNTGQLDFNNVTVNKPQYVGGVVGYAESSGTGLTNSGYMNFTSTYEAGANSYIGGVCGNITGETTTLQNEGEITLNGSLKGVLVGGCIGTTGYKVSGATNSGKIEVKRVEYSGNNFYGGVVGQLTAGGIHNSTNTGELAITNVAMTGHHLIGGITPEILGGGSDLTNEGDININLTYARTDNVGVKTFISGIGGLVTGDSSNFLNKGDITVNGSLEWTRVGGIGANADASAAEGKKYTGMKNEGNITFNADVTLIKSTYPCCIGGVYGDCNTTHEWENCYNKGNIIVSKDASTTYVGADQYMFVGGLIGAVRIAQTFTNCYNSGNVTIEKGATIYKGPYTGGCFGWVTAAAPTINATNGMRNIGNVTVLNAATAKTNNYVGGVVGYNSQVITYAQCVCDVVAPGVKGVGMITGVSRGSSAMASACKLGGRIAKELDENGEPAWKTLVALAGDKEFTDPESGETTIIPGNPDEVSFFTKIYGGEWASASASNCDNCSYLSAITIE